MLELSPPLWLSVDCDSEDGMIAGDEGRLLLVLEHRNRIRHLRLFFPVRDLQVMAINEQFRILEYLIVNLWVMDSTALMLPETLQAPNLRSPLPAWFRLSNTVSITSSRSGPCHTFSSNKLFTRLLPTEHSVAMDFIYAPAREFPNRDVERQLTHTPITTHYTSSLSPVRVPGR